MSFFISLFLKACSSPQNNDSSINKINHSSESEDFMIGANSDSGDLYEIFFISKGVLVFNSTDKNLKETFMLLNEDNTIHAQINLDNNSLEISGHSFSLDSFVNNDIASNYKFKPKEFYPDYSIIQFEYIKIINDTAVVFINKEKGLKKRIKLENELFIVEPWEKHLLGCMIDFNKKNNPIRVTNTDKSTTTGYEDCTEDHIFTITKIDGDWVKIECAEICDYPCSDKANYDGWIRWKDKDKLLIRLLYSC